MRFVFPFRQRIQGCERNQGKQIADDAKNQYGFGKGISERSAVQIVIVVYYSIMVCRELFSKSPKKRLLF